MDIIEESEYYTNPICTPEEQIKGSIFSEYKQKKDRYSVIKFDDNLFFSPNEIEAMITNELFGEYLNLDRTMIATNTKHFKFIKDKYIIESVDGKSYPKPNINTVFFNDINRRYGESMPLKEKISRAIQLEYSKILSFNESKDIHLFYIFRELIKLDLKLDETVYNQKYPFTKQEAKSALDDKNFQVLVKYFMLFMQKAVVSQIRFDLEKIAKKYRSFLSYQIDQLVKNYYDNWVEIFTKNHHATPDIINDTDEKVIEALMNNIFFLDSNEILNQKIEKVENTMIINNNYARITVPNPYLVDYKNKVYDLFGLLVFNHKYRIDAMTGLQLIKNYDNQTLTQGNKQIIYNVFKDLDLKEFKAQALHYDDTAPITRDVLCNISHINDSNNVNKKVNKSEQIENIKQDLIDKDIEMANNINTGSRFSVYHQDEMKENYIKEPSFENLKLRRINRIGILQDTSRVSAIKDGTTYKWTELPLYLKKNVIREYIQFRVNVIDQLNEEESIPQLTSLLIGSGIYKNAPNDITYDVGNKRIKLKQPYSGLLMPINLGVLDDGDKANPEEFAYNYSESIIIWNQMEGLIEDIIGLYFEDERYMMKYMYVIDIDKHIDRNQSVNVAYIKDLLKNMAYEIVIMDKDGPLRNPNEIEDILFNHYNTDRITYKDLTLVPSHNKEDRSIEIEIKYYKKYEDRVTTYLKKSIYEPSMHYFSFYLYQVYTNLWFKNLYAMYLDKHVDDIVTDEVLVELKKVKPETTVINDTEIHAFIGNYSYLSNNIQGPLITIQSILKKFDEALFLKIWPAGFKKILVDTVQKAYYILVLILTNVLKTQEDIYEFVIDYMNGIEKESIISSIQPLSAREMEIIRRMYLNSNITIGIKAIESKYNQDGFNGKDLLMYYLLVDKFKDEQFKNKLLNENKKFINTVKAVKEYKDLENNTYWGVDNIFGKGQNRLGKLLEYIQNDLTGNKKNILETVTDHVQIDLNDPKIIEYTTCTTYTYADLSRVEKDIPVLITGDPTLNGKQNEIYKNIVQFMNTTKEPTFVSYIGTYKDYMSQNDVIMIRRLFLIFFGSKECPEILENFKKCIRNNINHFYGMMIDLNETDIKLIEYIHAIVRS